MVYIYALLLSICLCKTGTVRVCDTLSPLKIYYIKPHYIVSLWSIHTVLSLVTFALLSDVGNIVSRTVVGVSWWIMSNHYAVCKLYVRLVNNPPRRYRQFLPSLHSPTRNRKTWTLQRHLVWLRFKHGSFIYLHLI